MAPLFQDEIQCCILVSVVEKHFGELRHFALQGVSLVWHSNEIHQLTYVSQEYMIKGLYLPFSGLSTASFNFEWLLNLL